MQLIRAKQLKQAPQTQENFKSRLMAWIRSHWNGIGLLLVTMLALALRVFRLDTPLGYDEIWQYQASSYPLNQIIPNLWIDHSPLFFFFSHFMLKVSSYSHNLVLLRLPAALFGVLVVPATYLLAREITANCKIALLSAFAATFAWLLVSLSQFYRMYSLLVLLTILAVYCLLKALPGQQPKYWLGFIFFSTLNLYNHYNALLVVFESGVFCGVYFAFRLATTVNFKWLTHFKIEKTVHKKGLTHLWWQMGWTILSFGLLAALYLPWLPHLFNFINAPSYGLNRNGQKADFNVNSLFDFVSALGFGYEWGAWLGWLEFILVIVGFGRLLRQRFYYSVVCLCYLGLTLVTIISLSNGEYLLTSSRYYSFAAPFYLILVSQGLVTVKRGLVWLLVSLKLTVRIAYLPVALLLMLFICQSLDFTHILLSKPPPYQPTTAKFLESYLQPDDTVLTLIASDRLSPGNRFKLELTLYSTPDQQQETTFQKTFLRLDSVVSWGQLQQFKSSLGNLWLLVQVPGISSSDDPLMSGIKQAAGSDFISYCDFDTCLIGFNTANSQDRVKYPNKYAQYLKMLERFKFLATTTMQTTQKIAMKDCLQGQPIYFSKPGILMLSEQPSYVLIPAYADSNNSPSLYCVTFKYTGSPSRIFVGVQNNQGVNIAILPDWEGYTPPLATDWLEDGLMFEAPVGTIRSILTLLAEDTPAQAEDFKLYKLSP